MGTVYRAWMFYDPKGPRGAPGRMSRSDGERGDQSGVLLNEAEAMRARPPNVVRFIDLFG